MKYRLKRPLWLVALSFTQVAWTQYFTSTGAPVRWNRSDIPVVMDSRGTDDVPGDLEFDAIAASMQTWNEVPCPHPTLHDDGRVSGLKPGPNTKKNLLVFWDDPSDWSTPGMDHVIALTTLYYDDRSGVAQKFDMEFADWAYEFTVTTGPARQTDVQNTVTHEFGHVLGLDHSKDPEATMYYSAQPGDLSKRTLAADDITGLCFIYESWSVPDQETSSAVEGGLVVEETGATASSGGCRTAATRQDWPVWLAVLAGFAVFVRLRRGGRRASSSCRDPGN